VLSDGGTIGATVLSGGVLTVQKGGRSDDTVVSSGGLEAVSGTAKATTVSAGGSALVSSGGIANTLEIEGGGSALVQSGSVVLGATIEGGILEIARGAVVNSSTFTFSGGGTLVLDDTKFRGTISGTTEFAIDLTTLAFHTGTTTANYAPNSSNTGGVLTVTDGTATARLTMLGQYSTANFSVHDDGSHFTLLTFGSGH
jgi:autotransporter passenger strand-loop-strand repeat protein